SSLPHPGLVVPYNVGGSGVGVPQCPDHRRPSDPSRPPRRRVHQGTTLADVRTRPARHPAIVGLGCRSPLHPARCTTLPAEVPRGSLGHRTRAVSRVWLAGAALFFTGFGPQEGPPPDFALLPALSDSGKPGSPALAAAVRAESERTS